MEPIAPGPRPADTMAARFPRLLLAIAFAAALASSAFAGSAYACECAIIASGAALDGADLAFEGTVLSVAITPSVAGRDTSNDPLAVTFAVERILKWTPGGPAERIIVSTPNNLRACGVTFLPGERWRVYAALPVPGGNPQTGSCSGDELLGTGSIPPGSAGPPVTLMIAAGIIVAVAAVVAVSGWAYTRRPRGESA